MMLRSYTGAEIRADTGADIRAAPGRYRGRDPDIYIDIYKEKSIK